MVGGGSAWRGRGDTNCAGGGRAEGVDGVSRRWLVGAVHGVDVVSINLRK